MKYNLKMDDEGYDLVKSMVLNADLEGSKKLKAYSYKVGEKYLKNKERIFQFILCMDEIFNNCIIHAYNKKGGEVKINFFVKDEYLIIDIRDFGIGINIKEKNKFLSLNENLLIYSGRGLFLVNNLCDKLFIKKCNDGGTLISFYFKMEESI